MTCAAALAVAGCGSTPTGPSGPVALTADLTMPECDPVHLTCSVNPNALETLTFVLTQGDRPLPGQTLSFSLMPPSAGGATLVAPSAVTDANGNASASIRTGVATAFTVVARGAQQEAEIAVIVESGPSGTVLVAPFLPPSSSPLPAGAPIEVSLYDGLSCSQLDQPPTVPQIRMSPLNALGDTAPFEGVSTTGVSAATAQVSTDKVVAKGCVDIPGSSIQAGGTVEVWLPLYDATADPLGTYAVTTTMTFAPPLAAAAALAAPWTDLSDCPLDPAQDWLDFTVNGLSPATSSDPLTLGQAIATLRGVPLVDGNGAPTSCRSAVNAAHDPSLDAVVMSLFGSPLPAAVVALPAIADDAGSILDDVQLLSTLTVAPSSSAGGYIVTHTLSEAQFGPKWSVTVPLAPLGLPTLTAFPTATAADNVLTIGTHGFTLRLGTAAWAAFGPLSLVPRGLPPDVSSFVPALFGLAKSPDGTASGCDALDGVVCSAVGQSPGCAVRACEAGLTALVSELDGAFSSADGTGLDLSLSGSAPLIESASGLADQLGADPTTPSSQIAVWSVNLRTSLGSDQLSATFQGKRN